ncbi:MAG: sterol desaturase family protein [Crocinitomicaceae bacterium]|nr:sterol desaturase family protein [Crocinitomicaceae bacterium]
MIEELQFVLYKIYSISGLSNLTVGHVIQFNLVIFSVFLIELLSVGWERSSLKKLIHFNKSSRTDVIVWLFEVFSVFNLFAFLLSLGSCYYLAGLIQKSFDLQLISHIENGTIQFIIVFVLSDLKEYFKHLFFHKFSPFWAIHEFHHSATNFNILTTHRFHFLQSAFGTFFDVIPYVLLGVPIQTYIAVKILSHAHTLLVHSNITHSWGIIGKYVLVSPAAHRIHHSVKKEHFDKNFAGTFIFWDRLFGTYHPPTEITELGIPDNPYNKKSFIYDVWLSIRRFFEAIQKLIRK